MKILYDTTTETLAPYPRGDDDPVVGLDPRYLVLELSTAEPPQHNEQTHMLQPTETIDLDTLQCVRGWAVVERPVEPVIVTFRALAFVLNQAGLYQQVKAAAMSSIEGEIWWNTAQSTTVQRDHPFVAALGQAIGQTSEQLDAIFAAAASA